MPDQRERFGQRLRRYREAKGYSQEELAERAGLSANAISALERGERRRPYPDTVRRLAEALELGAESRAELAAASRPNITAGSEPLPAAAVGLAPSSSLPDDPTPLIGREREVDVVRHLLTRPGGRLLTLIGSGGVGKTRLALQVARETRSLFPGGLYWVELAPLTDHRLVVPTIARALGLHEAPRTRLSEAIQTTLQGRRALLVLDNVEHVLESGPDIANLMRASPDLTVLATSRAPLNLRGELEYVVPPLELPLTGGGRLADVAAVPSVQLFVWHVRQRTPSFELSEGNIAAVAAICRRLDGVPLALELAAARVKLLGIVDLLARLDRALPILTGGARDLPARQQTMDAAIQWSYDLLREAEQTLFRRLAVFAGGWTLDAAEAVVNTRGDLNLDIVDGMSALVNHSLVRQIVRTDAPVRFTMLETTRQFGLSRLDESSDAGAVRDAHLQWCVTLAETAEARLAGPEQAMWLARLEEEHDNLRAALGSGTGSADEACLRLAGALWRFWWWHGHYTEGRAWLHQILASGAGPRSAGRAKALMAGGILAREQGDFHEANIVLEESLSIRRESGDQRGSAQALNNLGLVATNQGEFARAVALYDEALGLYSELDDRLGVANVLNNLGIVAREQGDFARAAVLYSQSLAMFRKVGEQRGIANTLHNLGRVARDQGDFATAIALYEESMSIKRIIGDRLNIAMTLNHLGNIAREQGNLDRAARLYEESLVIRVESGDRLGCVKTVEDVALLAASRGDTCRALSLLQRAMHLRGVLGAPLPPADRERYAQMISRLRRDDAAGGCDEPASTTISTASTDNVVDDALAFLRHMVLQDRQST